MTKITEYVATLGFDIWLDCPKSLFSTVCFSFGIKASLFSQALDVVIPLQNTVLCMYTMRQWLMGHQQQHCLIILESVTTESVWRTLGC